MYVGEFEVKSFYRLLSNGGSKSFPWRFIWKVRVPLKLSFFVRTAVWGKILILDNL